MKKKGPRNIANRGRSLIVSKLMVAEDILQKRFILELLQRSITAGPAIVIVAIVICFFPFGLGEWSGLVSGLAVLIAVTALVRVLYARAILRRGLGESHSFPWLSFSYYLNVMLWTLLFGLVFSFVTVKSSHFMLAFLLACGLTMTSVLTLSFVPKVAVLYQICLVGACGGGLLRHYYFEGDQNQLIMVLVLVVYALYLVRQSLENYQQMRAKFSYEIELEQSLQMLKESRVKLEAETIKSAQSSRLEATVRLANGLAHEINNPLAIILGALEQAGRSLANQNIEAAQNKIEKALDSTQRISQTIKSLRYFVQEGKVDTVQFANLQEPVDQVLLLKASTIIEQGIQIRIARPPAAQVRTKLALFSEVLLKVIENAINAIQGLSSEQKYIYFNFSLTATHAVFEVVNSGPVIPIQIQDQLFLPFFTTKEVGEGRGLSLSSGQKVMQSLGGDLWFDAGKAQTTFCLSLPLAEESRH